LYDGGKSPCAEKPRQATGEVCLERDQKEEEPQVRGRGPGLWNGSMLKGKAACNKNRWKIEKGKTNEKVE